MSVLPPLGDDVAEAQRGNLALTGTATASSSAASFGPEKAIDASLSTGWRASAIGAQWLKVDLGGLFWLDQVRQTFETQGLWRFTVEGSVDNTNWATVVDRSRGIVGRSFAAPLSGVYRYVRLSVQAAPAGAVASSRQLLVSGTDEGRNLAVGRTTSSSTNLANFEPGKATDGNSGTYWAASSGAYPQWLRVDLGAPSAITSVEQSFKDVGAHAFKLEASLDGASWTMLLDRTQSAATGQVFRQPVSGTYRYVRLTVTGSAAGFWAGSAELAVYGFEDLAAGASASTKRGLRQRTVDLGGLAQVHRIEPSIGAESSGRYRIEASRDNTRWRSLSARTSGADGLYRYVRVTALQAGQRDLPELQVFGTPVERNLAVGTSATSSSLGPGFEPFLAVDGNASTYWGASSPTMPQALTVDLGNASLVQRIEQSFVDNDTWKFTIEGSLDKTSWTMLLDRSGGVTGRVFSQAVNAKYRYVRLTVLHSAAGHWACSQELKVFGIGTPVTSKWWESRSGVMRFYPVWQQRTLDSITGQLDSLREQGYSAIELAPVFEGYRELWAGLAVTNLYAIHPDIGTMQDFLELIAAAHARDLKVIFFANPGYAHVSSPYFRKAEDDFRNGVQSVERSWFDIRPQRGEYPELWHYSERANGYYWGTWDKDAPSFNFSSQAWLDETRKYMRFWMDKGVDGIVLDAPNVYHTTTVQKNNYAITDVLRNYDTFMNGEGVREPGFIYDWHYNSLQDYTITQWGIPPNQGASAILSAIDSGNPSGLDATMKNYRDLMVNARGVSQTPPNWGRTGYPVPQRLLEMATLTTMGTLFYLHNDYFTILPHEQEMTTWTPAQRETVSQLVRAQNSTPALGPAGLRVKVPTQDDAKYLALKRVDKSGTVTALVVLNFQGSAQNVTVNLTGTGIATSQTPVDLLTGDAAPAITSANYTLNLPAHGFAVLAVTTA